MLKSDRLNRILDHVSAEGSADVHELAALLDVSRATVRRDLQLLDERGLLQRTHGGAVTAASELPLRHRTGRQQAEKQRIAAAAAALVPEGAVVGLTGGTTVSALARELAGRGGLTVVTNAVNIAADLVVRPDVRLVVVGGEARAQSYELVGPSAERMLDEYHLDMTFLGVDGLTVAHGCSTHDQLEAHTDRAFLRAGSRTVVVADSTKIGKVTFARICPVREIGTLVTDAAADGAELAAVRALGVEVLTV
ncbi:DeoR/GlpR family DNA-binding transcription regulator [Streptomyces sp. LP05-1]|uniref:DeoR/GlpR family DNA-binding transcription regulator n=1 Tax=Streptomyces pyxinae TaxID=2970734 RepID=A0ABT2CBU6_9ACTN|nr:DeoR/GlpR family DNA-binding transcription regulator [Streptomyces sp. LP05-1]MCS0634865.1 DeoR/GlpR family DNA-binding transcription regulator [Streptomyces sp. LP05-1]